MVTQVIELIDPDRQWWNEVLINETFDKATKKGIKPVPLLHLHNKDCVLWIDTASGLFTVRSAYSLVMQ